MSDLRTQEQTIGRVASSPFFARYTRPLGGTSSDAAQNWLRQFGERVIQDALTTEDAQFISACDSSRRIARELGLPDSDLDPQQLDAVMTRLQEAYPQPPEEEEDDADFEP